MIMLTNINIWAVLAAGLSAFLLGGIWYSPLLFVKTWCKEAGVAYPEPGSKKGHGPVVFIIAISLSIVAAFAFAKFLGPAPAFNFAVLRGFIIGACFVATSFGINYLFAQKSMKLFLIDGVYHILQFTLYGVILGLWH